MAGSLPAKSFIARNEMKDESLGLESDFAIKPKKLFCQKHPRLEIEYCSEVNGKFYCKACLPEHRGHNDKEVHSVVHNLQRKLADLRSLYYSKKNTLVTKVQAHLGEMESVFKVYYDALDNMRHEMLGEEYDYLEKMDGLETRLTKVVNSMKKYNVMEFFHEERELN